MGLNTAFIVPVDTEWFWAYTHRMVCFLLWKLNQEVENEFNLVSIQISMTNSYPICSNFRLSLLIGALWSIRLVNWFRILVSDFCVQCFSYLQQLFFDLTFVFWSLRSKSIQVRYKLFRSSVRHYSCFFICDCWFITSILYYDLVLWSLRSVKSFRMMKAVSIVYEAFYSIPSYNIWFYKIRFHL